jgi:mono/diheme cytochrome c family protein
MSAAPSTPPPSEPGPSRPQLEQAGASDTSIQTVHAILMREKPEPAEGYSPIPIFLLFVFCGLVFWAGSYIERYSGNFNPLVYDHRVRGAPTAPAAAPQVDPMVLGARLYAAQCAACHQQNGQGLAGNFPPLADSEWVVGEKSAQLLPRILLYGLNGAVQVRGLPYNGQMPAFGQTWRDNQIAAVLTYIRASWGNSAPPITPEEVAAVRAQYGQRGPWRGEEILAEVP